MSAHNKHWFGEQADVSSVLMAHPGRIMNLLHQEFEVVRPWRDLGPRGVNQRPVLLPWQVGTRGVVVSLIFDASRWNVRVEYRDPPPSMDADEMWPEIPLHEFLHSCEPISEPTEFAYQQGAANDD